jgi:DNA-binding HxlR family transcriptional regulator
VLTQTLRNLEEEGLICRTVYPEVPPRVEYRISDHGESVLPLLQQVRTWGREHIEWKQAAAETERSASTTK